MPASESPGRWPAVCAALLVLLFALQSLTASRMKGPTSDEPYHIAAGLSYILQGRIQLNQQHPPLLKELSGLSMAAGGVRWPKDNRYAAEAWRGNEEMSSVTGSYIVAEHGVDRAMLLARLPLIALSTLLGVLLFLWGRSLTGPWAAMGAVLLFAFDPTLLAHSYLVTTDCGIAVFTILFLWMLWRYLQQPTAGRLALCGLCLGLTLAAKFSGVVIPPIAGVLLVLAGLGAARPSGLRLPWLLHPYGRGARPISPTPPAATPRRKSKPAAAQLEPGLLDRLGPAVAGAAGAVLAMCAAAFLVLQVVYFFPSDPFAYLAGYRKVNADHDPLYLMYMAGTVARHFSSYYAVASLVKLPLPILGLFLFGLWQGRKLPRLNLLFLLLPPAALFVGYSIFSDNLGIRYIIPVLPFVYLVGGIGLAALLRGSIAARAAAAAACLWLVVAAAGIYPDHLSYFNEAACLADDPRKVGLDGGSRCGPWLLDDSNVDWGGSLPQLKEWLDRHAPGRRPKLAYLGSYPPRGYGIDYEPLPGERMLPEPAPGLYVVSAHYVARIPALAAHERYPMQAAWLRNRKPTAVVGHGYWIWDVPAK